MKDLTQVNGIAVVGRTRAKYTEGDSPSLQAVNREIATVDELMLADESIIYQCMHPAAEDCVYTNERAMKVTAHQAAHSASYRLRQTERKLAAAEAELAQRKQRQREGGLKAAETRKSNRLNVPAEAAPRKSETELTDVEAASRRVVIAYNAMQDAIDEFQKVFIGYMRVAATASGPDPTIVDKAAKWDKYVEFQQFITSTSVQESPNGAVESTPRSAPRRRRVTN